MITQRIQGQYTVLELQGDINLYMVGELRREILSTLHAGGIRRVALDLSRVGHIDSSGLGLLVQLHRTYEGTDGMGFVLLSLPQPLQTALRKASLDSYFKTAVEQDLAAAG